MNQGAKTLFLTLDTFAGTGGIQKVCRTLSYCLKSLLDSNFKAFSLYDQAPDTRYINDLNFTGFNGRKVHFICRALISGSHCSILVISHINLISIALLIRIFNRSTKIVMLAHGTEVWRHLTLWKKWFIGKYVQVWSVSNYTKQVLYKRHHIRKFSVLVSNCLDPFFQPPPGFDKPSYLMERYSLIAGQPILLTICRLNSHENLKGYDQVILSLKNLLDDFPGVRYLLCGQSDQQEFNRLQLLITAHNLCGKVLLPGFIPETEITDHYLLADIFILPSQKEGFGLVFIEAAACGCRIIAANAGGSPDALLNGKLGTLIDPTDFQQLQSAILKNLNSKNDLRAKKTRQILTLKHFGYPSYRRKVKRMLYQ